MHTSPNFYSFCTHFRAISYFCPTCYSCTSFAVAQTIVYPAVSFPCLFNSAYGISFWRRSEGFVINDLQNTYVWGGTDSRFFSCHFSYSQAEPLDLTFWPRQGTASYLLTQCSRVLVDKLTGSQLVKKCPPPPLYGTSRFITEFTTAQHLFSILSEGTNTGGLTVGLVIFLVFIWKSNNLRSVHWVLTERI